MSAKIMMAAVLGLFVSSAALADQMGPNGDKFYEAAAHFANACAEEPCKTPYTNATVYNQKSRLNKLTADQTATLKKVAWEQAQIWGDTILEGDVTAAGRTRLDMVVAYYKDNTLAGYKIQYSEKAWDTSTCNYDGTQKSLKDCKEGRIQEMSYVSPDMQTYFSDEDKHADFLVDTDI